VKCVCVETVTRRTHKLRSEHTTPDMFQFPKLRKGYRVLNDVFCEELGGCNERTTAWINCQHCGGSGDTDKPFGKAAEVEQVEHWFQPNGVGVVNDRGPFLVCNKAAIRVSDIIDLRAQGSDLVATKADGCCVVLERHNSTQQAEAAAGDVADDIRAKEKSIAVGVDMGDGESKSVVVDSKEELLHKANSALRAEVDKLWTRLGDVEHRWARAENSITTLQEASRASEKKLSDKEPKPPKPSHAKLWLLSAIEDPVLVELKPCPHCYGRPEWSGEHQAVVCTGKGCGMIGPNAGSHNRSVVAWNRLSK